MNMFDTARAMSAAMRLYGITQQTLAEQMGVSQSYVANKLRLLGFDAEAEALILSTGLSERHARAILRLPSGESRLAMISKAASRRLTVRECEALVEAELVGSPPMPREGEPTCRTVERFRDALSRGVAHLSSRGIFATEHVSYIGRRTYITVILEE